MVVLGNCETPQIHVTLAQLSQDLCGRDLDADMLVFLGAFRVPSFSQVLEMPLLLGGGIPREVKQELRQNFGTGSVWSTVHSWLRDEVVSLREPLHGNQFVEHC